MVNIFYMMGCGVLMGVVTASCGITYSDNFGKALALNGIPIVLIALAPLFADK